MQQLILLHFVVKCCALQGDKNTVIDNQCVVGEIVVYCCNLL
mgnify:CR=1 FL=1